MGPARRSARVAPVPRATELDAFIGEWVAIKDGHVIAHAESAREVARQLRAMGPEADDAVLQRASSPTEALAVGLG